MKIMRCGYLCNGAKVVDEKIAGTATERALLEHCLQEIHPVERIKMDKKWKAVFEIPFNPENKYQVNMFKLIQTEETEKKNQRILITVKGAPERVMEFCSSVLDGELNSVPFGEDERAAFKADIERACEKGERCLVFAEKTFDVKKTMKFEGGSLDDCNFFSNSHTGPAEDNGLLLLGFISLVDPPKMGARKAVSMAQQAGVKVMMVTGDHPVTAKAIAMSIGMTDEVGNLRAVTGPEIDEHQDEVQFWDELCAENFVVFARTTPIHKVIIVEQFKTRHYIVAVTGDGVNDSPAISAANVGIAMGLAGTDVAKESADIVLNDDNFSSIINGIKEGRLITDNIKKSIAYTLCSKLPQLAPSIAWAAFGIPLAMSTLQLILIDLGTDIWTGVMMAYEGPEGDLMKKKPRPRDERMVGWKMCVWSYLYIGVIQSFACFLAFQFTMYNKGAGGVHPSTMLFLDQDQNWGKENLICFTEEDTERCVFQTKLTFSLSTPEQEIYILSPSWQKILLMKAQTTFFITLVQMQIVAALVAKTRMEGFVTVGTSNKKLACILLAELLLAMCFVYFPSCNVTLATFPLEMLCWFLFTPFAILLFLLEDWRKHWIRGSDNPQGHLFYW